jgi:hypothetical protein
MKTIDNATELRQKLASRVGAATSAALQPILEFSPD